MEEIKDQFSTIDRVKIWKPRDTTYTRVRVLVAIYNMEEASRACKEGIF